MLDILRQGAQSWGIKILFGIIIAVFVLAFGVDRSQVDRTTILATVNDAPILFKDYQERLQRNVEMMRNQNPGLTAEMLTQMGIQRQVLEQMVSEELMLQKAASLGLTVSKEELASEIHLIPAFQNESRLFDPTTYQNVLQANNLTPGKFESEFMRGMLIGKLQTFLGLPGRLSEEQAHDFYSYGRSTAVISYAVYPWEDYRDQVNATDEQVAEYYASHTVNFQLPAMAKAEYLLLTPKTLADTAAVTAEEIDKYYADNKEKFKVEEQVKARHILIRVDENAAEADVNAALEKIKAAQADLEKGMTFAEAANTYTEDPSGTQTGGELGWFGRGRMVKPFEDAAFALQPGEVSDAVRTQFGFHLILVEETKPAGYRDFQDVTDEIRLVLAQDRAAETLQDRLDQALEMVLTGESLASVATTLGLGLAVQETDLFTKDRAPMELLGLSPENVATLFDLEQNATTQTPLAYQDGYILATKRLQQPESIKPLEDVRQSIVEAIVKTEALKLAKAAADAALPELLQGGNATLTLTTSEPFGRQGEIPGLGLNQQLSAAAFAASAGTWLPEAYALPQGYVLARTERIDTPTAEEWAAEKDLWLTTLNQRAEEQTAQAVLADLRAKADVRILDPSLIDK